MQLCKSRRSNRSPQDIQVQIKIGVIGIPNKIIRSLEGKVNRKNMNANRQDHKERLARYSKS